ncbi:glyoxalase superfamily protein [Rhizobium rhizogenes]|uniref:glyoxalase superfamily protein n=1 Tax=Rhizobium rhizogenes TaxID=359 RepID=UPI0015738358|nr:glyoxalase superfamily protein [Rhizobium rhizogenes]NTG64729.1 hypothetical protein [Rhizobium rhizogenes]NTH68454.1 hypothetical protein [Rhizobium rhizogenes]NTH99931.1 hypothetical protein [Rhizobium rhizogenes]NTI39083.1 hypothetical protein [Rhizobium rhizogenes]NTJ18223.1 hypothetical protein [Rhizobium rhizogenes]
MNSFLESKAMAKALRLSLAERNVELSHSTCLELVARQFGFADWNVLSARIAAIKAKQEPLLIPAGWFPTGFTDTTRYRIGLDETAPGCALIECVADRNADPGKERFACMMQSIDAQPYQGTRLKLTATLRTEDADCGTIWMRIDGIEKQSLRFDNMMSREENGPINATTGWTSRSIVLDVPTEAASIHYGFFLKGYGKVWARSFSLEVVFDAATVTEIPQQRGQNRVLPNQPINLDFTANAD